MSPTSSRPVDGESRHWTLGLRALLSVAVVVSIALFGIGGVTAADDLSSAEEPAAEPGVDQVACAWAPSGVGSYYVACVTVDADQDGAEVCVEDHRQLSDYQRPHEPRNEYCVAT